MPINDEKFEELKAANRGTVIAVETIAGTVVCRKPTRAELFAYVDKIGDTKTKAAAINAFVRSCVVHPSKDDYDLMTEEAPGIALTIAPELNELAGIVKDAEVKK